MVKLNELQPVGEMPEGLVQVPTFIQGSLKEALIPEYEKARNGND